VAIEPDGSVYPCCLKTKAPLGNLTEERLIDILASLKGHPAFEAINDGDPERMAEAFGKTRADYRAVSETIDPNGRPFANMCIGCDAFFETHLKGADCAGPGGEVENDSGRNHIGRRVRDLLLSRTKSRVESKANAPDQSNGRAASPPCAPPARRRS
jgi:hypothetical protein